MPTCRDMDRLHPLVREKADEFKADCKLMGIPIMVVETIRSHEVQVAYYAQGRETLDNVNAKRRLAGLPVIKMHQNRIITNAIESIHEYGCALDFALLINGRPSWDDKADINDNQRDDYNEIGQIAKSHGFKWGGDFSFRDLAHIQYTGGLSIKDLRDGKRPERDVLDYI